ncbi:uncharacterized protein DKFZp434B061 [Triticum aestivum]|uniref:uncharacterized protein DKFZp434B061 n=1 Tax=Triticum aestivum TaxID=4565 RepID=UPI001D00B3DE|nr:uncharacterized protein DKFZp434B061-like [Triticum aestivum]
MAAFPAKPAPPLDDGCHGGPGRDGSELFTHEPPPKTRPVHLAGPTPTITLPPQHAWIQVAIDTPPPFIWIEVACEVNRLGIQHFFSNQIEQWFEVPRCVARTSPRSPVRSPPPRSGTGRPPTFLSRASLQCGEQFNCVFLRFQRWPGIAPPVPCIASGLGSHRPCPASPAASARTGKQLPRDPWSRTLPSPAARLCSAPSAIPARLSQPDPPLHFCNSSLLLPPAIPAPPRRATSTGSCCRPQRPTQRAPPGHGSSSGCTRRCSRSTLTPARGGTALLGLVPHAVCCSSPCGPCTGCTTMARW